jgi:hypothetical protein
MMLVYKGKIVGVARQKVTSLLHFKVSANRSMENDAKHHFNAEPGFNLSIGGL